MSPCSPPQPPAPSTNPSGRKVFCLKFQKEMPGLDAVPWPGELGQRAVDAPEEGDDLLLHLLAPIAGQRLVQPSLQLGVCAAQLDQQ